MSFAVRTKVLDELFKNPKWTKRMEEAKTTKEVIQVLEDFCKQYGKEVVKIY